MSANRTAQQALGIYHGWWNVVVSFVGLSLSYAMFTVFSFGVFVAPLEAEFGWSRVEISAGLTITNITIVFCSPLVGTLVDRFGVRRILIPSVALMGLAVTSMYLLQGNILHFYAMYLLIPLLGAGTLPLSYSRVIVAWFTRRRGIALGISLAGFGVGATLVPPAGQWLIETFGWREAYLAFGAAIFLINLPLTIFLLRESPANAAVAPERNASRMPAEPTTDPEAGLTGRDAIETRSFWYIFASFLLVGFAITSILAHLVPMLIGRGIEPGAASLYMGSLGAGLIVGRIVAGKLMDHFFAPYVTAATLFAMFIGMIVLALNVGGPILLVAVIFIGLALGSEISEIAYIVSRYFGALAFGQIYGTMFAAFQLGSAFGAPALGYYFDRVGNYIGALWGSAALVLLAVILILRLKSYPDLSRERPA